jgi:hypothetical protein
MAVASSRRPVPGTGSLVDDNQVTTDGGSCGNNTYTAQGAKAGYALYDFLGH